MQYVDSSYAPMVDMDALVNIANSLFVLGYLVKDMLWLRVLSFGGACCLALYFGSRPEPLMQVTYWNLFFASLNALWICRLVHQRCGRPRKAA